MKGQIRNSPGWKGIQTSQGVHTMGNGTTSGEKDEKTSAVVKGEH